MPKMHFHVMSGLAGGYMPNSNWATDEADTAFEDFMDQAATALDDLWTVDSEDDSARSEIEALEEQIDEMKDLWADEDSHDEIIRNGAVIVLRGGLEYISIESCTEDCELDAEVV